MALFSDSDMKEFDSQVEDIVKTADLQRYEKIKPTLKEMWDIIFTVRDFVIEKKRKIYGGFALNKLIESVAPEDKFYDDDDIEKWDIDFYSPEPIADSIEIANRLHDKGYRFVLATEAQHDETYKVFAETMDCADISYVPRNIYNKMPFKEIDGLHLTGAHFMMIDYFRVITDPLTSYHRLKEKNAIKRLELLDKHFKLPHNSSSIDIMPAEDKLDIAFKTVHEFLSNRESVIVIGTYAYNHYISQSQTYDKPIPLKKKKTSRPQGTDIKLIPVNYYETLSTSYKLDAKHLILKLREKFLDKGKLVTYEESYPFFQYLGYSVTIKFEDEIICKMYHYNNRCTPYHTVDALYFGDRTSSMLNKSKIQIGTFPLVIMYNLISIMKARADNDQQNKNLYYTMNSHLIELKERFMSENDLTVLNDTLFQYFVLRCKGKMLTAKMEKQMRIQKRKDAGGRYTYSYNPEVARDKDIASMYRFKNTSGNPIKHKNFQINLEAKDMDIVDDIELDDDADEDTTSS